MFQDTKNSSARSDAPATLTHLKARHDFASCYTQLLISACFAVAFLERVQKQIQDAKQPREEAQPLLFLRTHVGDYKLQAGDVAECKTLQEDNRATLDTLQDVCRSRSLTFLA